MRASAAESAKAAGKPSGKRVNVIMIWQDGGPSHYESFDPKPDAPSEIRGEFKSIKTAVPGIHFSECVPELAKVGPVRLREVTGILELHGDDGCSDRLARGSGC